MLPPLGSAALRKVQAWVYGRQNGKVREKRMADLRLSAHIATAKEEEQSSSEASGHVSRHRT